jgi:hypothetical protein
MRNIRIQVCVTNHVLNDPNANKTTKAKPMRILMLMCLLALPLWAQGANSLAGNESPYLAMHGNDPVNWQPWSAEVLAQAKRENKLLFVSIGYFSCHWCHVMQRESFQNAEAAALLNEHFISVKVDRELHPDLDAYLIDFVQRTRGSAGWPLNVFLTPDGHPLVGMTYVPADTFITLLTQLREQWEQGGEYLKSVAAQAVLQLQGEKTTAGAPLDAETARRYETLLVQQALQLGDELEGGFGEQTKFPMTPHWEALLTAYPRNPEPKLKALLELTLDQMATQGLRDHLGGGFFRYTVDPGWQTPHFEKMLYDNALLASLYLRAARVLNRPDYETVARGTLDFMLRDLAAPEGGMMASLSAVDASGEEGGHYLWRPEELAKLLSADELSLAQAVWGMTSDGALETGYLPRARLSVAAAAAQLGITQTVAQQRLDAARKKLLAARAKRSLPVDTKRLAAWNGLALSALVQGAQLSGGERYRTAAKGVRDYLVNTLWDGKRLLRARGKAGELGQAGLEDYAFAAEGLLAWARLTNDGRDLSLARRWVEDAWRRFYADGGWQLSDQTLLPTGYGVPMLDEGPLPSPATVLMRATLDISDDKLKARAMKAVTAGHETLAQTAFDRPSVVRLMMDYPPVQ